MPTEAIHKLEPHRTLYLRGFDRRGCAASLNNASASGFTVSGVFSDQADFAVLVLFDADDQFGHLFTTRYLPDFSLAGVTLDFDLAITNAQNPVSRKYQSVPWGALSYITKSETPGHRLAPADGDIRDRDGRRFSDVHREWFAGRIRPDRARLSEQRRLRFHRAGQPEPGDLFVLRRSSGGNPHAHHRIEHVQLHGSHVRRFVRCGHRFRPGCRRVRRSQLLLLRRRATA